MKSIRTFGRPYGNKFSIIIIACIPILLFAVTTTRGEEISATHFITKDQDGAISITSKKMTLKNQENTIFFEGDVIVERDSIRLKANKVEVVFNSITQDEQGQMDNIEKKRDLSVITATENVEFTQGERTILSDRVVYFKNDEKMVFTGSPNVREGRDELKGKKITVYIKEDRVVVEGGEAIIHPR